MTTGYTGSKFLKDHEAADRRDMVRAFISSPNGQRAIRAFQGKDVTGASSVESALDESDANFTVSKTPLMAVFSEESAAPVEGFVALTNDKTGATLGITTPKYAPLQSGDTFAPAQVLVERGDMQLSRVQVVDGGKRIRLSGLVGLSVIERHFGRTFDQPDMLANFATFTCDHTGKGSNTAQLQSIRVICMNGVTTLEASGMVRTSHVGNATERMREAYRQLLAVTEAAQIEAASFQRMAAGPMTPATFRGFAAGLLDKVRGELTDDGKLAARERELRELEDLFLGGAGNTGSSLWDGYNAVTEWVDHQKARAGKVRNAAKAFESAQYGTGQRVKAAARAMLTRW